MLPSQLSKLTYGVVSRTAMEDVSLSDTDTEVSIGTEIPDLNSTEDNNCLQEEASANCIKFYVHYEHGNISIHSALYYFLFSLQQ